jgi:hypothetical protein
VSRVTEKAVERPILFRGENVRAIIAGRKTQARRVVRLPFHDPVSGNELAENEIVAAARRLCPDGAQGDRLWVRENLKRKEDGRWYYAADDECVLPPQKQERDAAMTPLPPGNTPESQPASYMPRWAARLILQITGVRVQRLQDISIDDAVSEGPSCWACGGPIDGIGKKDCVCCGQKSAARASFVMLWEVTHAQSEPWAFNPLVWVLTFRRTSGCRRSHGSSGR